MKTMHHAFADSTLLTCRAARRFLSGLLIAIVVACAQGQASAAAIARVTDVGSDDTAVPADVQVVHTSGAVEDARSGQDLAESDRIRTGWKSHATLDFGGKATVRVQALTEFKVGVFQLGTASRVELWLKAGEIQAQVRKEAAARTEFTVKTPTATASVRGTEIESILYTPQTHTRIAMGATGRLLATGGHGPSFEVSANARAREDTDHRPLLDDAHLRSDDSRALVEPAGFTREEQEVNRLEPIQQTVSPSLGATGSSLGPLPPPRITVMPVGSSNQRASPVFSVGF